MKTKGAPALTRPKAFEVTTNTNYYIAAGGLYNFLFFGGL